MKKFSASRYSYNIIISNKTDTQPYPLLRNDEGTESIYCVSPNHGRSFIMNAYTNGRYIVSKGNGLSYSSYNFFNTGEFGNDTWGLLLAKDAVRDFKVGIEISDLGIKTNRMEYVMEILYNMHLNGKIIRPYLLQYSVECPYRINDAPFVSRSIIEGEIEKWNAFNEFGHKKFYLIAAEILVKNLYILHSNSILHNAIHVQNYTWALELLDFELSHTPAYPYDSEDAVRHVKTLFTREIIQTYEIINYIAYVTCESIDFFEIESIFSKYGFDLRNINLIDNN